MTRKHNTNPSSAGKKARAGLMRQRIADWRRERRIRELSRQVADLIDQGLRTPARVYDEMRMDEIRARSPQQVARMEARMGLRARTDIKRHVMHGYTHGRLPHRVVSAVFRICRLKSL